MMTIASYNLGNNYFSRIVSHTFPERTVPSSKRIIKKYPNLEIEPVSIVEKIDYEIESFDDEIMAEFYYFLANENDSAVFTEDYLNLADDYDSRVE